MSEEYIEINVQEIMQEIREDIARRKLDGTLEPFDEFTTMAQGSVFMSDRGSQSTLDSFNSSVNELLSISQVSMETPLVVKRKFLGGLERWIKKLLRKAMRFVIWPIVTEQNYVNKVTANSMDMARTLIQTQCNQETSEELVLLQGQIRRLEKRITELENPKEGQE